VRSGPGSARTILLVHIISARPSKQPLMVRTFLKVYMELGSYFFVSARTNKRHHHQELLLLSGGVEGSVRARTPHHHDDDDVFYLYFQKQQLAYGHIPSGYSPPRNKEAHVMMRPP
jgi:hypothetical protein